MKDFGHGAVGTREQAFTALLPNDNVYPAHLLADLAANVAAEPDTVKDGADPEENLSLPAGYTYFGQFVDHDLTFDNTSSLNPTDMPGTEPDPFNPSLTVIKKERVPSNLRSPRFDLDSLYGDGPDAQPYMYAGDGASLLFKNGSENACQPFLEQAHQDLLRSPNGRAIIGDKRNDENSIVSQIQLTFIKFHNAVVAKLKTLQPDLKGTALFTAASREVRWAYQKLVIEDFLPRIVRCEVLQDLAMAQSIDERNYALYTEDIRSNLPLEFVGAAYRFGHSGVRFGYRLNAQTALSIFPISEGSAGGTSESDSLLGFDPLPQSHVIDDWGRFFPSTPDVQARLGKKAEGLDDPNNVRLRLQFAYKIDTTLADPLTVLPPSVLPTSPEAGGAIQEVEDKIAADPIPEQQPQKRDPNRPSLALLNLLRGNSYRLQSGQAIAEVLQEQGFPAALLAPKDLVTRQAGETAGTFKYVPIAPELQHNTPLWFYILAEAQQSVLDELKSLGVDVTQDFNENNLLEPAVAQTQLGWVGGRIVAEVFYGLMDSDTESYFYAPEGWAPIWVQDPAAGEPVVFADLIRFAGQPVTQAPIQD
jgi:Animal haem peroxidase